MILKTIAAAALAAPLLASGAVSASEVSVETKANGDGFYANVNNEAGWRGGTFEGAVTEFHVGYDYTVNEKASVYLQGGPALVSVEGEGTETEFSLEFGGEVALADKLDLYGDINYITGDEDGVATEVGLKYSF